jgi:hypothetical protein
MMCTIRQHESLRAIFGLLKQKGVRLVVAQVMDDVGEVSRDQG